MSDLHRLLCRLPMSHLDNLRLGSGLMQTCGPSVESSATRFRVGTIHLEKSLQNENILTSLRSIIDVGDVTTI